MKLLRGVIGLAALAGWFTFAFAPRAPVSAGPPVLDVYPTAPIPLQGTVLQAGESLAMPTQVAVVGERLVLVDRFAARSVHVLSASTGDLIASLGREGDGPGEFRVARFVDPDPDSPADFWVFDAGLSRLTLVEVDTWDDTPAWEHRIVNLHADATVMNPVWVDRGTRLLATGLFSGGRLAEFDSAGAAMAYRGALPAADQAAPPGVLQHAYRGMLKSRPDRMRLVLATRHAGSIEIYDPSGLLITRTSGPFTFDPIFEVDKGADGPGMASGEEMRLGYVDVAATDDRIYALFSGRTREGYPDRATYGEYVHVFDWEGAYLGALRLDSEVAAIATDVARDRLIAVRHLPAPAVLSYPLGEARRL